jgi:hypothetical protein
VIRPRPADPIPRDDPRYRIDNGEAVIDVRVTSVDQLFDNRDPAPFRRRDLDPGLVEYLVDAGHDVAAADRIRIVFWVEDRCPPGEVENGVHAHFDYELKRLQRRRREQVRTGWVALAVALVGVVLLVGLAELVARVITGTLGAGIKEALVISSWVLLWRPVELLIYDGIPGRRQRRVLRRLLEASIEIRAGGHVPN